MRNRTDLYLGIIFGTLFIVIVFAWIVINIGAALFPNEGNCRAVGLGGIAHVPANCMKYYIK